MGDPKSPCTTFEQICVKVILQAQLQDPFCAEVPRKPNDWEVQGLEIDENGLDIRTADKVIQIFVLH